MALTEREVFDQALAIEDRTQREEFLDRVCEIEGFCRSHMEGLLVASDQLGDFLERPAAVDEGQSESAAQLPLLITERPGKLIGRYKLLQIVGEGGCGVVFMAEQHEPVRRLVALKVIKPGMDTRSVIARFEAERQALALMDHPNIAKVLDGGETDTGRPYFVMELVRGARITDYCDQNNLSTEQRLALFMQICHAIQHAHQKGIIHRDIKPSNVLVTVQDGVPTPKVIDFGIAKVTGDKLTDKTLFTDIRQIIGTPAYMSPEQADLANADIDTRSDIYSLGVLLYELLTGHTPLDSAALLRAGLDEMRKRIREDEPPKPSTRLSRLSDADRTDVASHRQLDPAKLAGFLRGDLDSIAMKCLDKDRTRRYETTNGLAMDVQRYLSHEPVLAGPPSAGYRLKKFVRRNRGPVIAAASAVAIIAGGIVALVLGLMAVERERRHTSDALDRETAALAAEMRAKEHAAEALRKMTDEIVEELIGRQEQFGEREKRFLRDVQHLYEEFTREQGDMPAARAQRAEGYHRVARIRAMLGERTTAEADYRRSVGLLEQLVTEFPANAVHRQKLAASYRGLGNLLRSSDRRQEAEKELRQAVSVNEQLLKEDAKRSDYRINLVRSLNDLANCLQDDHRPRESEEVLRRGLAVGASPGTELAKLADYRRTLAVSLNSLGLILRESGKHANAAETHRKAIEFQRQLVDEYPDVPIYRGDLAVSRNNLGFVLQKLGMRVEAKTEFNGAIKIREELVTEYPAVPGYRVGLAAAYINFGEFLRTGGDAQASLPWQDKGIHTLESVLDQLGQDAKAREFLKNAHWNRASALEDLGRHGLAVRDWQRAAAFERPADRTTLVINQVLALLRSDSAPQAAALAGSLRDRDRAPPKSLFLAAREFASAAALADGTVAQAYRKEADKLAHESLVSARRGAANDPHRSEADIQNVGEYFYRQGRFAEGEPMYREALKGRMGRQFADSEPVAFTAASLGRLLSDWSWTDRDSVEKALTAARAEEALRLLRQCMVTRVRVLKPTDQRLLEAQSRLGFALVAVAATNTELSLDARLEHLAEAEPLLLQSWDGMQSNRKVDRKYKRDALQRLARLYEAWDALAPSAGYAAKTAKWRSMLNAFDPQVQGKTTAALSDAD